MDDLDLKVGMLNTGAGSWSVGVLKLQFKGVSSKVIQNVHYVVHDPKSDPVTQAGCSVAQALDSLLSRFHSGAPVCRHSRVASKVWPRAS